MPEIISKGFSNERLYLDTSVLIPFIGKNDNNVSDLLFICKKNKDVTVFTSPFAIMEAIDIKQEHSYFLKKVEQGVPLKYVISQRRERDLSSEDLKKVYSIMNEKLKSAGIEWFYYPDKGEWWKLALDIVRDSNINSSDAIHLAQAVFMGCTFLVTTDTHLIKEGNKYLEGYLKEEILVIGLPSEAIKRLKKK